MENQRYGVNLGKKYTKVLCSNFGKGVFAKLTKHKYVAQRELEEMEVNSCDSQLTKNHKLPKLFKMPNFCPKGK